MSRKSGFRYIPGLDGLRAFAVLAVIAYHFNFSWSSGGFLGVDFFFVLSGYLITSLILPLKGNDITLDPREFWMGRIRRLLPASFVMIIATVIWVVLFNRELLSTVRGDAISAFFYTTNWWYIFHDVSYFDSFGSPSPIKNLWSLAIEEQFYIIWPVVLITGLRLFKKRGHFSIVVFLGLLSSAWLMSTLFQPGSDPSRVYYGTDTRSFELMTGCWLALLWPMKRLSTKKLPLNTRNFLNGISIFSFALFILSVSLFDEFQPFIYRGGMLLFCLNAAVLIACVCHPSSYLGKLFGIQPLNWIGTRSYGIYLWHYPVIVLSTPVQEIGNPVYWRVGLQLGLTFILADLSYRFIETPIRKQGFKAFFQNYFSINHINSLPAMVVSLPALIVFIGGITGVVHGKNQSEAASTQPTHLKISSTHQSAADHDKTPESEPPSSDQADHTKEEDEIIDKTKENKPEQPKSEPDHKAPEKEAEATQPAPSLKSYSDVLAIGDSVMLDIASRLQQTHTKITIDGKVGRQVSDAVQFAPEYAAFNQPNKAVIIELGTNGYFMDNQMETLLDTFSNADIYLVNTRVPRPWESKVNAVLLEKAKEKDNITLVDWHAEAINHPEYFGSDGVHLASKGKDAMTHLINQAMK